ncbi:hypothetical protein Bca52824_081373 [Brassica carinata]|uniref:Uncharacterized protein n=1 Tax=Brassica carinata TaxID=52824 RepID=A0A8X7TR68_BRACI|nr:hypothetical protein Bca52824_081373 [Brassica carinata]
MEREKERADKNGIYISLVLAPRYPDLSLSLTIPPRPTGTGEEGSRGQTETMLNPLWPKLELVMTGTSADVHLPPDHEARFSWTKVVTKAYEDSLCCC